MLGYGWGYVHRNPGSSRKQPARTCSSERRTQTTPTPTPAPTLCPPTAERGMEDEGPERTRISNGAGADAVEESRSTEMSALSENTTANRPRSRRVDDDKSGPPEDFRLSTTSTTSTSSSVFAPSSLPTTSPPIPPRSPLRPTVSAGRGPSTNTAPTDAPDADEMPLLHSKSFGSISGLLDQPLATSFSRRPETPHKPLPLTPQPSEPMPLSTDAEEDEETLLPSLSPSTRSSTTPVMSKRHFALNEILSTEQAYAQDLTILRLVHIPMALGQPSPFSAAPATPPGSSASSSRTLSTASDSSSGSNYGPAMTRDDIKVIFNNVVDLAAFSDSLVEDLEKALGDVLQGGTGPDSVGELFLRRIPEMEPLYRTYVTKQDAALEHLNTLPQSRALTEYLAQTRQIAQSMSHAWDIPSLLIKPVQRLMKYSLLLQKVIEQTPDSHPDKENLIRARAAFDSLTLAVNEGRRRREVVREVLTSGNAGAVTPQKGDQKPKKKGLNIGIAASVSLGRMKSIRTAANGAMQGPEANAEAESVKKYAAQVKHFEAFLHSFLRDAYKWAESVRGLMTALDDWAQTFGQVIWMESESRSEAFDAFLDLISEELIPICDDVHEMIQEKLAPPVANLINSTTAPLRLYEAMHTLEPLHYGLLNLDNHKSRPPPQLLEASQSYVALRAQLSTELPDYLRLFSKGIASVICGFAVIQQSFYSNVRDRWGDLWDALKVDEEANQGAAETLRVWWERFGEVEVQFQGLSIIRPLEKKATPEKAKTKQKPRSLNEAEVGQSVIVSTMLAALDPLNIPLPSPTAMSFSAPGGPHSAKTRSMHSTESENGHVAERKSVESLHSKKSGKSRRPSTSRGNSMAGATLIDEPPGFGVPSLAALAPASSSKHRSKGSPLSPVPMNKSQPVGRFLDVSDPNSSTPSLNSIATLQEDSRGRPSRKPSFRRRLTDTFRTSTGADTRHRRSPSLPNYSTPSPSPSKATFAPSISASASTGTRRRPSGGQIPALYQCRVIHPCGPPDGVAYHDIPFFTLRVDDVYDILQEAGHPSTHRGLPLYVDDGEDCLLLARNEAGDVGWVLASFLLPVD